MPSDSRRIPGPESSLNPDLFSPQSQTKSVSGDQRPDSRSPDEARPIFLKSGVIPQARGSAYIEMKNTKVICAVYGPRDIGRRDDFQMEGVLKCEFKYAPFSCKQRRGHIQDNEEIEYSQVLTEALEPAVIMSKFPKSQVDVYVTVLENDGGSLSAGIMAASLALSDACIEMYDMVTAFTVRQMGKTLILLDPTAAEEFSAASRKDNKVSVNHGNVTVALLPLLNQVSGILSTGVMDCDVLSAAIQKCTSGAQGVYPVLQKAVANSYNGDELTNGSST